MRKRCFIFIIGVLLGDIAHSVKVILLEAPPTAGESDIASKPNIWKGEGEEFVADQNIYQMRFDNAGSLPELILKYCKLKDSDENKGVIAVCIDEEWEILDYFALEISPIKLVDGKEELKKGPGGVLKEKTEPEVTQKKTDPSEAQFCITYLNRNRVNQDILYRVSSPSIPKGILDTEKSGQPKYFTIRIPDIRMAFGNLKIKRGAPLDGPATVFAPRQHKTFYRNSEQRQNETTFKTGKMKKTAKAVFDLMSSFPLNRPISPGATEITPEENRYTFVVVDDAIRFSHTGDDVQLNNLSKHCIHAYVAEYVYCAGEFLVTGDGDKKVLHLLNNSGSYRPQEFRMRVMKKLFKDNFPGFDDENLVLDLNTKTDTKPSPLMQFIYSTNRPLFEAL